LSSPLVNQFKKGGISRDVRLTGASGALPLTPFDQVELLFLLTRDSDEEAEDGAGASRSEPRRRHGSRPTVPADALAFLRATDSDEVQRRWLQMSTYDRPSG
jgi:hypothetical protein